MKRILLTAAAIALAAPAAAAMSPQTKEGENTPGYSYFMSCAAFNIADAKIRKLDTASAKPSVDQAELFKAAAFASMAEKSEEDGAKFLESMVSFMIARAESEDERGKQDIAEMGEICQSLEPLAKLKVEKAEEALLRNAT